MTKIQATNRLITVYEKYEDIINALESNPQWIGLTEIKYIKSESGRREREMKKITINTDHIIEIY